MTYLDADKRTPSLTTLNKIAAYLKKDLRDLLQEKEGAFIFLEDREAAFALINSADTPGRKRCFHLFFLPNFRRAPSSGK